jgi:hypothetical protein
MDQNLLQFDELFGFVDGGMQSIFTTGCQNAPDE